MPRKTERPTQDDMRKAEKEIGENIPRTLIGRDDGDVRTETEDEDPSSRH